MGVLKPFGRKNCVCVRIFWSKRLNQFSLKIYPWRLDIVHVQNPYKFWAQNKSTNSKVKCFNSSRPKYASGNKMLQYPHIDTTHNALQLFVFFFSIFFFFCQPYLGLHNCKLVFLILKISQYDRSKW